jgi:hypothetical protein
VGLLNVDVVFQRLTTYRKSGRLLILRVMGMFRQLSAVLVDGAERRYMIGLPSSPLVIQDMFPIQNSVFQSR